MTIAVNVETGPLDHIREGKIYRVREGQLIMRSPIFIEGELVLTDNASLFIGE